MYNLELEMRRRGVSKRAIYRKLAMTYRTLNERLRAEHPFRITEAFEIRDAFFPELSVDYLFSEAPPTASQG